MSRSLAAWPSAARLVVAAGLLLALAGCKADLYDGLQEREALEIVGILQNAGIEAGRTRGKDGAYAVTVERDQTTRAINLLGERGLPRQRFESLGGVFDSKRIVSTPMEERARFMFAMNQELANSITQIAGVTSARVHIMLPEDSPLEKDRRSPRASVFIYHRADADMARHVGTIKYLITNSVAGLHYEDVAVALFPAAQTLEPSSRTSLRAGNLAPFGVLAVIGLGLALFRRPILRLIGAQASRP
ncbi:type III secretion inner membrane ring lipoprotein SctJ [Alsobacter sp. KACC 23698]|uniref:Lipoprotein n=1 Tax=Alsobacter sp. KACC 23698 TaxID=3149229 RepID=A0AAU7JC69_9HYPH